MLITQWDYASLYLAYKHIAISRLFVSFNQDEITYRAAVDEGFDVGAGLVAELFIVGTLEV